MKIKALLAKFDKDKYKKMIEIFNEHGEYNLQSAYLTQLVMLQFLEENNLIQDLDYYKDTLSNLLKNIKIEEESDISKYFFELYDKECMARYLHFSYNIINIKLENKWINNFHDFIYNWFYNLFFNKQIGLSKKDLSKILNTEI